MTLFKNTSQHPIKLMIHGQRRTIVPGQTFAAPATVKTIPGLTALKNAQPTILPPTQPQYVPQNIKQEIFNNSISHDEISNFSNLIDEELFYHRTYHKMTTVPSVTIAILTKGALDLISNCCESILNKVEYPNVTLMICDTGTKDRIVWDYYKEVEQKCSSKGFSFKLISMKYYQFSKNYNEVSKHVDTDFFLIQNNDTVALNDYVSKMMKLAVLRNVASVGPRMFYPDKRIQHDGQFIFTGRNETCDALCGHLNLGRVKEQLNQAENTIKKVDGNTAAGCLVRTRDFTELGGFDVSFKDIFQDVDLMIRLGEQIPNRFNYCHRNAEIIHIDNATRMNRERDPNRLKMMFEDQVLLVNKASSNGWVRKNPKRVEFSIVVLAHDFEKFKKFLDSLRIQRGTHRVELICFPNYNNIFKSVGEAYNTAIDIANGDNIIMCHDDIEVPFDWLNSIKKNIITLDKNSINWGVLGPAGVSFNSNRPHYYLNDSNGVKLSIKNPSIEDSKDFYLVDTLDELCLIIRKSSGLKFNSEAISGFHFYGADLCYESLLRGMKNLAISAYCHHSSDGFKNLNSKEKFHAFVQDLKKFDTFYRHRGITRWRTTTSIANEKQIEIYATPDIIKEEIGGNLSLIIK